MKKQHYLLAIAMLSVVAFVLAACGGDKKSDGEGGKGGEDFLQIASGGTGGTYYPLGGGMAKILEDEADVKSNNTSSNASAENVALLEKGDVEIAFVQTDVVANAVEGVNAFEGKPVKNVQAMGSLYPETIQIVTTADSGINSVEDLKGKAVSVGAPGSGTSVNAEQILEIHGMTMDDIKAQNLDFDESTDGIQDGTIDAAFVTAGTPTGSVEGLSASVDVRIVPIDKDKAEELVTKYPYYAADTVEAGTYDIPEDVNTVAVLAMLAVRADLSEDVIYKATKAIYENTDKIGHDKAKLITIETALDGVGIDLHPGAKKYFKEQGLEVE